MYQFQIVDRVAKGTKYQCTKKYNVVGTVQEEITKTYSVHAVVDQKERAKIAFHEAVTRGLIDSDTGEYIHNVSNIRVPVEEAINRGELTWFVYKTRKYVNILLNVS